MISSIVASLNLLKGINECWCVKFPKIPYTTPHTPNTQLILFALNFESSSSFICHANIKLAYFPCDLIVFLCCLPVFRNKERCVVCSIFNQLREFADCCYANTCHIASQFTFQWNNNSINQFRFEYREMTILTIVNE